jgi:uncharacterized repeat protein (TIGR02543 family)
MASSPGTPTRSGYTFAGWFTASSGGSAISFPYTHGQTANFTLYAQWTANTYSVSYDGNTNGGGSVPAGQTKTHAVDLTLASNLGSLTKSGYSFGGWCTTQPAAGSACGGTSYAAGATYSTNAAATLYAVWTALTCATGGTCAVGDTGPGRGIVFYVQPGGGTFASPGSDCGASCRYLEVAPAASEAKRWWATNMNWDKAVSGADATAIGSGYQNTVDIVGQAGNVAASSAAVYAFDYSNNGKIDWHLPSREELNELCKYARSQTTGDTSVACTYSSSLRTDFSADYYWSSSEHSANLAWHRYFDYGFQNLNYKWWTNRVRPVRAF